MNLLNGLRSSAYYIPNEGIMIDLDEVERLLGEVSKTFPIRHHAGTCVPYYDVKEVEEWKEKMFKGLKI